MDKYYCLPFLLHFIILNVDPTQSTTIYYNFMFLVFIALSACIAVQLGYYPTWMFFQCFCAMTLFYCAHWQTYVSGKKLSLLVQY